MNTNKHSRLLSFSPDGRLLAWASGKPVVDLWDFAEDKSITLTNDSGDNALSVAFSPDGQRLATAEQSHTITVLDVPGRKKLGKLRSHTSEAWVVAFSPDGQSLASGGFDHSVRLWNASPGPAQEVITNSVANPATVTVPVGFPINTPVAVNAWIR